MKTFYTYKTTTNELPTKAVVKCGGYNVPIETPIVSVENGTYYYTIQVEVEQLQKGIYNLCFYNNTNDLLNSITYKN